MTRERKSCHKDADEGGVTKRNKHGCARHLKLQLSVFIEFDECSTILSNESIISTRFGIIPLASDRHFSMRDRAD